MPVVGYVARRGLATGHVLGSSQTLEFSPRVLSPSNKTMGENSTSLSGIPQSVVWRRDEYWDFKTVQYLQGSPAYENMFEFLESVDLFERFTIDIDGTVASPSTQRNAILVENYQRVRVEQNPEFYFQFKLRIIP